MAFLLVCVPGVAGYEGELIDAEAFATVSPWNWLGLGVGYRYYRATAGTRRAATG